MARGQVPARTGKDLKSPGAHEKGMELPGTCQLCQTVGQMHTCKLCGLLVCKSHYHSDAGACSRCMQTSPGHSREGEPGNLPPLPDDAGQRKT